MQTTSKDLLGINKVLLLRTWGPLIFISKFKFTKMSVQVLIQSSQRSKILCHEPVQCGPYLTPLPSGPMLNVTLLSRAAWLSVFALCLLTLLRFPVGKLAKGRNNSQALSEFDCCFLVLRYRRFLKANFNVQFDDQLEFYNVT